ncbi:MAG: DUF294 nucleotidyltransferase-like domain-containing protein [Bacteroidota bacterium]
MARFPPKLATFLLFSGVAYTNPIAQRIYDFLKDIPPFSYLDREALLRVCNRVEVQYQPINSLVFERNTQPPQRFYVVREGAVDLIRVNEQGEEVLVERSGEGEVFGIRPLLAEDNYQLRARAAEETLLYAINAEGIRQELANYPRITAYLMRVMARGRGEGQQNANLSWKGFNDPKSVPALNLLELQSIHPAKEAVTCPPETTVTVAAEIMTDADVGSIIIVDDEQHPLGIFTDRDIRRNIATGLYGKNRPIKEVMTKPVVCVPPNVLVAEIQIAMVKYDIHHIVVTEDGTNQSAITGVISEHDLLVLQGNNPAILVREIARTKRTNYLRELRSRAEHLLENYLEQEVNISFISTIMTEINDEINRRCIELSLEEMQNEGFGKPPSRFAWMCLGSQGRGEQLLRTDQDNALVYESTSTESGEKIKAYFLELAQRVTERLFAVGYDYCPANMMASNPSWCLSLAAWKRVFSDWMREPNSENILKVSVFFDFRSVYGATDLTEALTEHIFQEIEHGEIFLSFLAKAALQNPAPLTFFRNFMVERSGEHKDQFDLKARAMMPLTDAARVLILQARRGGINNTIRRFTSLAEIEPQHAELYRSAAEAYEILIRLRAIFGLRRNDSGRFLKPSELSRLQRLLLRNTFNPVREVQQLLEIRFQLNFIP